MKKLLIVMGLVLVLTLAFAGMAFANAGPHGGYDADTAACAGCHRAHTAVGAGDLLTEANVTALCTSCHGGMVTTNVLTGVANGSTNPLNGGGFQSIGGVAVSSTHSVADLNGSTGVGTAWGGASSGTGINGTLECDSCHNPHGSTNYRILRDSANGYPYGASNAYKHTWDYVAGQTDGQQQALKWADNQVLQDSSASGAYAVGAVRTTNYTEGMNDFCATCHKQYETGSGSSFQPSTTVGGAYFYPGTQDAVDGKGDIARYRHVTSRTYDPARPARPIRFAHAGNDPTTTGYGFTCLSCHNAHGTTATASGYAAGVAPTNDSALLYYNNRGTCKSCHQAGK